MQIDLIQILIAILGLLVGAALGYFVGKLRGRLAILTTALQVKNPELWELLHFYVVDEAQTDRISRRRSRPAK